jgi:hypothetical protein
VILLSAISRISGSFTQSTCFSHRSESESHLRFIFGMLALILLAFGATTWPPARAPRTTLGAGSFRPFLATFGTGENVQASAYMAEMVRFELAIPFCVFQAIRFRNRPR